MRKLATNVKKISVILKEPDYLKLKRMAKYEDKKMSHFMRDKLVSFVKNPIKIKQT